MATKILHKVWHIISYFLAFSFVIFGTLFVYFYANGYRFNPINGGVKQTGVINIQTVPTKAQININGVDIGKSPKVTSIDVGKAEIEIKKEGYKSWKKSLPVVAEKSTSVTPTLFLENPTAESVYSIKGKTIQQFSDNQNQTLIALIQSDTTYKILRYEIDKRFWNITENPQVIYEISSKDVKTVSFKVSNDGVWALITITDINKTKSFDFAKITIPHQIIKNSDISDFSEYTFKWSNDSNYVLLESPTEILSYKINDGTKSVLLKKAPKLNYLWNSDSEGFFYYTTLEKSTTNSKFSIIQTTLQGGNKKTILKDIYFQNSVSKINEVRQQTQSEALAIPNSKTEELFSGDLVSFNVLPNTQGIILTSTQGTYWYNLEDATFLLVYPKQSSYISTSPDNNKFLFYIESENKYGVFTFKKIEADPLTTIGVSIILEDTDISDLQWQKNSLNVAYKKGAEVRIVDIDGYNDSLISQFSGSYSFTQDLGFFYNFSVTKEKDTLEVIRYKMY
jgi:hypothetical protein